MNIAVIEGFLEGPQHSRYLRRALEKRGHTLVPPTDAKTIIVHSGGWVFLPPLRDEQRIIFFDPAYKTEKPFAVRFFDRLKYDFGHLRPYMTIERLLNIWYALRYPVRWARLLHRVNRQQIDPLFMRKDSYAIGVGDRSWWHQPTVETTDVAHERTRGDHDYLWTHPEELIRLAELYNT